MGYQRRVHGESNKYPDIMKLLLSLCILGLAVGAPAPQEDEMIEAVPYVHEEVAAEPYVHDEPVETHDIAAEAYVHTEVEAEAYVNEEPAPAVYQFAGVAPVAYAGYPYTVAVAPSAPAKEVKVNPYAIAAPYYLAAVKTGCINSVGSVVPCAV